MTKVTIKLSQTPIGKPFDHPETVGFDFQFNIPVEQIKFTNKVSINFFLDRFYFLHRYFNGKSFKISQPIRMDVFIDDILKYSYCQIRVGKLISPKWRNYHRFKIHASEYILVEWNDQIAKKDAKKKEVIGTKESYLKTYLLFNTIAAMDNKFEKYWKSEISTPMYS